MPEAATQEVRKDITVVTPENFEAYVSDKLGVPAAEETPNPDPEAVAAAEAKKIEEQKAAEKGPKEGDLDGSKVFFKGKWVSKHDFSYRLHVQTETVRKEAEEKAKAAETKATEERTRREELERENLQLRAKVEPVNPDALGPKPEPAQFKDTTEFAKALESWTQEKTRREIALEAEAVSRQQNWESRKKEAKKTFTDYDAVIEKSKDLPVTKELQEAILDSDVGPHLVYHFAKNPDALAAISKMSVGRMLKEIGRLEVSLGKGEKEPAKAAPATPLAEISRAPAPITPINVTGETESTTKINSKGEFFGTFEEWKALRKAGKIR